MMSPLDHGGTDFAKGTRDSARSFRTRDSTMPRHDGAGGPGWDEPAPGKGLVAGLIGGLAGSLAMAAVQWAWSRTVGPTLRPAEDDVAGDVASAPGEEPSAIRGAVGLARRVIGREVPAAHSRDSGRSFHFAFGAGLEAAYGVLAEYVGLATVGAGLPFGATQVIFADELSVPALSLSRRPSEAPPSAHLASLAAHAAYGVTTEYVRRRVRARL